MSDYEIRSVERAASSGDPTAIARLDRVKARAGISPVVVVLSGPITKSIALTLSHGRVVYHTKLKRFDGKPLRARITGVCKVWKTRPTEFRIPIKHGLYDYGAITDVNGSEWRLFEDEALEEAQKASMEG